MHVATFLVSGTVLRLFAGRRENPGSQLRSQHRSRLSRVAGIQTVDPRGKEALLPRLMVGAIVPILCLMVFERSAFSQHQDEPGAENISGGQRTGLRNTAEFDLLGFAKHHGIDGHITSA